MKESFVVVKSFLTNLGQIFWRKEKLSFQINVPDDEGVLSHPFIGKDQTWNPR